MCTTSGALYKLQKEFGFRAVFHLSDKDKG